MAIEWNGQIGNWIGYVSGYGHIGFWQCTKESATEALRGKAQWEGGHWSIKEANDSEEHKRLLAPGRAGCYDVGERKPEQVTSTQHAAG